VREAYARAVERFKWRTAKAVDCPGANLGIQ
jgi:hypothetical protein